MLCYAQISMVNSEIAKLLRNVAAACSIKDENKFKFQIIAYQKAADTIENSTTQVKDLFKTKKATNLPGIGFSIQSHLQELFRTGKVKHFEEIMEGIPDSVFLLLDIPGFGPKRAYKLATYFKLKDPKTAVYDLKKLAEQNKIAQIAGFGEKSQKDILRSIDEYKKGERKIKKMTLSYASELAENLISYLKQSKAITRAEPLGSLRRCVSLIGDIDIAVCTNQPKEAINHFISYPHTERILEKGETSASIIVSSGKQIDLMTQNSQGFGALLQHFTGSKNHNIHLREYALKKGLSLSEYGIKNLEKKDNKIIPYSTEEDFYNALGMDWITPEIREDKGEIELAIKHELPKLIELNDLKGDLHIHSNYPLEPSHDLGQNTMEEMLKKAASLNYEYLGFSEHNPSVSKHSNNESYSILSKRKEKIEQIKLSNKNIRVINLLEVDILTNGNLAIDDKSLSTLDGAIISIHSSFSMNKKDMTKRVLQGLSHPKAKILAHPTGRLLNERNGYELDFEEIFDFCQKHNKALEINSWPARLDLPDTLVREAIKNNVKLVIDTDSHATYQMSNMKYGITVARRGWAKKSDILNTLPYNEFIEWLEKV